MNKQEKIISLLLGIALVWCFYASYTGDKAAKKAAAGKAAAALQAEEAAKKSADAGKTAEADAQEPAGDAGQNSENAPAPEPAPAPEIVLHDVFVSISNAQETVVFAANEKGVGIDSVTLLEYPHLNAPVSESNPPVKLEFGAGRRALSYEGLAFAGTPDEFRADTPTSVVYRAGSVARRFTLLGDYRIAVEDSFAPSGDAHSLRLGTMRMGDSPNDSISIDSQLASNEKGRKEVVHHDEDDLLKAYLVGGVSGGCGCGCPAGNASGEPPSAPMQVPGARDWVAVKNRFFVSALADFDSENKGFNALVERSGAARSATVAVDFDTVPEKRSYVFYAGPKKQSLLWDLGMRDVMEFGMWRWLCYPMVWLLTFFHSAIPSYGVAIILLTILVRLVFWPLTRKSTESMRKMQEIQPLLKEIQAKYKDNPQRMQQETWQLYREKKVNPLSSCLPMLVQIPVFIALFNVLRSAVELRYSGFLWISDLSEPERLFASWFPFGGLNILPIFMALTMYLQSKLTPGTGDQAQQRMMTVFMPAMMLVMFYNFASALSLYWALSQVMSIIQMWMIRRAAAKAKAQTVAATEIIDPPAPTRQMRRHG